MGLVTGYEDIKSKAYYHIGIKVLEQELFHHEGIANAKRVLEIARELEKYSPKITRRLVWDNTKSGYRTKEPETKEISIEDLEKIVENGEDLPIHQEPIIRSDY